MTLLVLQSLFTDIRFFFIEGTHKTLFKIKGLDEEGSLAEPVCVIGSPVPLPIITSSPPWYGACRDKLLRSDAMWCEAPLSSNHGDTDMSEGLALV